ncbi:MAG: SDR family oxidoreductase [Proteobacteria bacterium]|nr:SDR family oxidoreductase [Pseudomonadota bacterium]
MTKPRRTVLTTGANSGIGLASVIEVARRGYRSVGSVRSQEKAEAVRSQAREAGVEVETVLLDIADAEAASRVVEEVRPEALVNNAGYMSYRAFEDTDESEARDLLEVLLVAPLRLVRLALPHMRAAGWGRVVNVSSISGSIRFPMMGWYQGAKSALEAVSDALRMELASDGIAVVVVQPGSFKSGVIDDIQRDTEKFKDSRYAPSYQRMLEALNSSERFWGNPERVAKVIANALDARSPDPHYVVGADAWLNRLTMPVTPTRVRDFMLRRMLRL